MSDINSFVENTLKHVDRDPDQIDTLRNWMLNALREETVIAHYIAKNLDNKFTPKSMIILTVLTSKGLHGFDIRHTGSDTHNYVPLTSIEWIKEYQLEGTQSYVIEFRMLSGSPIGISDDINSRDELQSFTREIRSAIERLF